MNIVDKKELHKILTDLFKLGIGEDNDDLTIIFGKNQTAFRVRKLDRFYEKNDSSFIEFGAIITASNEEKRAIVIKDARYFKKAIMGLESEKIKFELVDKKLVVNGGAIITEYSDNVTLPVQLTPYKEVTVEGKELFAAYKRTLSHISLNKDRKQTWKINMAFNKVKQNKMTIGATDGLTASLTTIPCSDSPELSFYTVYDIVKVLSKMRGEKVRIGVNTTNRKWYIRYIIDNKYVIENSVKKIDIQNIPEWLKLYYDARTTRVTFKISDLKKVVKEVQEKGYSYEHQMKRSQILNLRLEQKKLQLSTAIKEDNGTVKFVPLKEKIDKYEVLREEDEINVFIDVELLNRYLKEFPKKETSKVTLIFKWETNPIKDPTESHFEIQLEKISGFIGGIMPVRIKG